MAEQFEQLNRIDVPELNEILGKPFKALDDGFIRVVDYMGADDSIVQAARVSYGKGTKKISEDKALIRYLLRHDHTTPFEMCEIKLHIRVPMDCWRQWIRHRTANVNEYSTRYSLAIDSAQKTLSSEWRYQSKDNKQGSGEFLPLSEGSLLSEEEENLLQKIKTVYENRINKGVAREQARKDLPLSTYTEAYWKIDLHNLLHFLRLRMDSHAQKEIRTYATVIGNEIVKRWCPIAWEAFLDYKLNSATFSSKELRILTQINSNNLDKIQSLLLDLGFYIKKDVTRPSRELVEFQRKLKTHGFIIPWNH